MWKYLIAALAAVYGSLAALSGAQAADLSKQEPIEMVVQLGTKNGDLISSDSILSAPAVPSGWSSSM